MNAWHYSRDLFRNSNVENLRRFLTNSMHELILLSKRKLKSKSLKTKQKQKQQKRKLKNKGWLSVISLLINYLNISNKLIREWSEPSPVFITLEPRPPQPSKGFFSLIKFSL